MTYKGILIEGEPTLDMFVEYTNKMGFDLDAEKVYLKYKKIGWLTQKHRPAKTVESLINAANGARHLKAVKEGREEKSGKKIPKPPSRDKNKSPKENYYDFLQSDYWRYVRKLKLKQCGNKCQICGSKKDLNIHHNTYAHHGQEHKHLEDLVVLCRKCHEKFHDVAKD